MRKQQIPNLLTLARTLAVPVALALIVLQVGPGPLLALFLFAAATDYLDGYLARKWNAVTPLGTMLDPIADKLLVALMLVYLAVVTQMAFLPIALILMRELYISGLREYLALRAIPLPVSSGGKWKTTVQMLAIIVLYGSVFLQHPRVWDGGIVLLWIATFLALTSAVQYTRAAWKHLR